ncbi:MAG: hypothetical protein HC788_00205 [Sphingopyxis sp.]|nr:hypothetical protein [Sphingopyxis sp.]
MKDFAMKRNTKRILAGAALATVLGTLVLVIPQAMAYGYVTTRATARIVCPMIFLQGRDEVFAVGHMHDLGLLPFDPRNRVHIERNNAERAIRVTLFGMFEAYSIYYPGEGCVLQ